MNFTERLNNPALGNVGIRRLSNAIPSNSTPSPQRSQGINAQPTQHAPLASQVLGHAAQAAPAAAGLCPNAMCIPQRSGQRAKGNQGCVLKFCRSCCNLAGAAAARSGAAWEGCRASSHQYRQPLFPAVALPASGPPATQPAPTVLPHAANAVFLGHSTPGVASVPTATPVPAPPSMPHPSQGLNPLTVPPPNAPPAAALHLQGSGPADAAAAVAPAQTQANRTLAQPLSKMWLVAQDTASKKAITERSSKMERLALAEDERRTVTFVAYHTVRILTFYWC